MNLVTGGRSVRFHPPLITQLKSLINRRRWRILMWPYTLRFWRGSTSLFPMVPFEIVESMPLALGTSDKAEKVGEEVFP